MLQNWMQVLLEKLKKKRSGDRGKYCEVFMTEANGSVLTREVAWCHDREHLLLE
jgi:hypothetical protein